MLTMPEVHWYNNTGVCGVNDALCYGCVNGKETADRNQQRVHVGYSIKLFACREVSQISAMNEGQFLGAKNVHNVLSAQFSVFFVMESINFVYRERVFCGIVSDCYSRHIIMVGMTVRTQNHIALNMKRGIGVHHVRIKNDAVICALHRKTGMSIPSNLH